jgi:predicted permease
MSLFSRLRSLLFNVTRRVSVERNLDAEVRSYAELLREEKMEQGMDPEEAHRQALIELGGVEQVKEEVRDVRAGAWFEILWQDARYGLRVLRKNPGFAAVVILTLALGISANVLIFSIVDAVLLRSLPYKQPDQLVWITEMWPDSSDQSVAWPNFQDWRRMNTVFDGLAGFRDAQMTLTGEGSPEPIAGRYVSDGYFQVMGVEPFLGRTFLSDENKVGGPQVAILANEFWRDRFSASPQILGRVIHLNGKPFTVVGVMPAGFGAVSLTKLWAPFEQNVPPVYLTSREFSWLLYAVGRLKPGTSIEQARVDMTHIAQNLAKEYPATNSVALPFLLPLSRQISGDSRQILILLLIAVLLLLFIMCANVASLLLVKTSSRQRELSVRFAVGAGSGRLVRQIVTEAMLLAFLGGVLGLLMAFASVRFAAAFLPATFNVIGSLSVDWRVLLFTFVATLLTGLFFSLAPVRFILQTDLQSVLQSSSHQMKGGHCKLHAGLVVCEVALAMAVLVGASLLARTMASLFHVNLGFDSHQLLTGTILLPSTADPKRADGVLFVQQALDRVRRIPGVDSAATVFPVPFTPQIYQTWLAMEGRPPQKTEQPMAYISVVSLDYLQTMRIPLQQGREFTSQDASEKTNVAMIDRRLADQYWPGQDPVGKHIKLGTQDFADSSAQSSAIIGIVGPIHAETLDADPTGRVYLPLHSGAPFSVTFVARTRLAPLSLAQAMRDEIHALNPDIPVFHIRTMDDAVQSSVASRRLVLILLTAFSLGALFLAGLGLYGVMAYLVGQQTNEIGLRLALGAQPQDILRMILSNGFRIVVLGIALGTVVSFAFARLMHDLLYGVSSTDPLTFAGVIVVLGTIALLACYVPARRAVRVDPIVALRYE